MPIGFIWQTFLETPLINFMVLLSILTFGSFGLAILLFTFITRVITFPLTLRTLRSTRAMQELQPRIQEIQKKYSDPRRRSEETMKLYREEGVNPLGCLGPQLIQLPLFIALYQVIRITLADTPERILHLSSRLYDTGLTQGAIPLNKDFLFMDLGDTGNIVYSVIVFAAMWLQQRISSGRRGAQQVQSQQAQMNRTLQWMLPIMFAYFTFVVPAGLGLYWSASTIIGILLQWKFVGPGDFTWGSLIPQVVRTAAGMGPAKPRVDSSTPSKSPKTSDGSDGDAEAIAIASDSESDQPESGENDESSGNQRKDGRRRRRSGARSNRPQSRSGRRRRNSRR